MSPEKIKVGDNTLIEMLQELKTCKNDIETLKKQNKEKDKALQDLSEKVGQAVSFSMES